MNSFINPFYISSFIIFTITLLFFIGIGGSINAYIKKYIGDDESINEGFGSINPFMHIDLKWFLLLLTPIKVIIKKTQPFSFNWNSGIKGFFQKVIYILGPTFLHLLISSMILFISVKLFGLFFFQFAVQTPIDASFELIKSVKLFFNNYSSKKIILILFFLYSITINIFLAVIELLINITNFILETYISKKYDNFWITFLCIIFIMTIFLIFSPIITISSWKLISFPLLFI